MNTNEEAAKISSLQHLFQAVPHGRDLAREWKQAIEFSLTGNLEDRAPLEAFLKAAMDALASPDAPLPDRCGLWHIALGERPFTELHVRAEVLTALRKLAGYESAVLVISGLKASHLHGRKYWTRRIDEAYRDSVDYIDQLACNHITPSTRLTLIYV